MTQPTPTNHARQVGPLRHKIAYAPALPFSELLPGSLAEEVIRDDGVSFRDRLFSPLVTLCVFLSQVLDPDHSCRAAVARFLAWRTAQGLAPCSAEFGREDVAVLYRMRWYAELDLRSLKQTMQMDILRCQSPEMVQKEVWAHLLAYNLLRGQMAKAAAEGGLVPLQISFKGALQLVSAFASVLWTAEGDEIVEIMGRLREAIRSHRVGQRGNRCEPRVRKRRPKHYPLLNESRQKVRSRLGATSCG